MPAVVLVNMPFADASRAPLALALLKAGLSDVSISARVVNANVQFAAQIGVAAFNQIVNLPTELLAGEWIFSDWVFGSDEGSEVAFRSLFESAGYGSSEWNCLLEARRLVDTFLHSVAGEILSLKPAIVGFSSSYHQTLASVALARLLQSKALGARIVMGGANCDGPMGSALLTAFEVCDAIFSGDADDKFPEYCRAMLELSEYAEDGQIRPSNSFSARPVMCSNVVENMDDLPFPDYEEYAEELARVGWPDEWPVTIPFETSRGCWWGAKKHCTFCGLNGTSMSMRVKSSERAIAELRWLCAKYGGLTRSFSATDNILPYQYFSSFLPQLEREQFPMDLFYEIKANTPALYLFRLKAAGVVAVQPGIESFSNPVLSTMQKGTTRLQNIRCLRICYELGITVYWNYLVGFPGEDHLWYEDELQLLPKLMHLPPPYSGQTCRVRFDRFSPYVENPQRYGIYNLRPAYAYDNVYRGLDEQLVYSLAYHFIGRFPGDTRILQYEQRLDAAIERWHSLHGPRQLTLVNPAGGHPYLRDKRDGRDSVFTLSGAELFVLRCCGDIRSERQVLSKGSDAGFSSGEIIRAIRMMEEQGFVISDKQDVLSLIPSATLYDYGAQQKADSISEKSAEFIQLRQLH